VAIGSGTELARVSADVILLGDGLGGLVAGVDTARRMLKIIRENLAWAVVYNVTAVPLAATGVLQPWMAAIGMSMSSLLVVLNALRILSTPLPRTLGTPGLDAPKVAHA
jgi:Cu2+-exporting ATPase